MEIKKRYRINIKEIYQCGVTVEAESKEEALKAVVEGAGEAYTCYDGYLETLDPTTWDVEELEKL